MFTSLAPRNNIHQSTSTYITLTFETYIDIHHDVFMNLSNIHRHTLVYINIHRVMYTCLFSQWGLLPQASENLRTWVGLQGYKVTRLQGYKVTRLQGYKVTRLHSFHDTVISTTPPSVTRLQGYYKVTRLRRVNYVYKSRLHNTFVMEGLKYKC
jgi:hypothetical protein